MKNLFLALLWLVALSICIMAQTVADVPGTRLMSEKEYTAFLDELGSLLPKWEARFMVINASRIPQVSYENGKRIMDARSRALTQISYLQDAIWKEKTAPKLSRQTHIGYLLGSISELMTTMGDSLELTGGDQRWSNDLYELAEQIGEPRVRIMNHVLAGIKRLEATCSPNPDGKTKLGP